MPARSKLGIGNIGIDSNTLNVSMNLEGRQALMPYTTPRGSMAAAFAYIQALHGGRAYWPTFNRDYISALSLNLQTTNATISPKQPAKDGYIAVTELLSSVSAFLSDQSAAYDIDSGVHNWNPIPGLTLFCWFKLNSLNVERPLLGNWNADITNAVYRMHIAASGNYLQLDVSQTGSWTASQRVTVGTSCVASKWYFATARWKPSTELDVRLYDVDGLVSEATNTTSIVSTLKRPGAASFFRIGANIKNGPAYAYMNGQIAQSFFGVSYLPDAELDFIWKLTRSMFKV